jgi:hypothetical protein
MRYAIRIMHDALCDLQPPFFFFFFFFLAPSKAGHPTATHMAQGHNRTPSRLALIGCLGYHYSDPQRAPLFHKPSLSVYVLSSGAISSACPLSMDVKGAREVESKRPN